MLFSGGLLLLGGRLADLFNRRRVFLAGIGLFTVASLVSGLASTAGLLIAARAGQGTGAALLTPAALSILMTTYPGKQRQTALAMWGTVGSMGIAAGVLFGGASPAPVRLACGVLHQHARRRRGAGPDASQGRPVQRRPPDALAGSTWPEQLRWSPGC